MKRVAVWFYCVWLVIHLMGQRIFHRKRLLVVIRSGGLGDIIATFPLVSQLRKAYPDRRIVYGTRAEFAGVCALGEGIDEVVSLYHGDAVARLAGRFFDVRSPKYLDELPGKFSTRHFVIEMAESIGLEADPGLPEIAVEPLTEEEFEGFFGKARNGLRVVALHFGPTAPVRQWDVDKWNELVQSLTKDGALVVGIGVGRHFLHGDGNEAPIEGVLTASRPLSFLESARLLKSCDVMVGIDSGPIHLAAAVGTPTVGLYGPVNPLLRASATTRMVTAKPKLPCQFCHHEKPMGHWNTGCPNDRLCMKSITVEQVLDGLKFATLLKPHPSS